MTDRFVYYCDGCMNAVVAPGVPASEKLPDECPACGHDEFRPGGQIR